MTRIKDNGDGSGQISYPVDAMRKTATDILNAVNAARQQHTTHWTSIQHYLNTTCVPDSTFLGGTLTLPNVSSHLRDVLEPHATRLTSSYDWLEKFAQALLHAANAIEENETTLTTSFE